MKNIKELKEIKLELIEQANDHQNQKKQFSLIINHNHNQYNTPRRLNQVQKPKKTKGTSTTSKSAATGCKRIRTHAQVT
jgi:hypothetical protein